MSRIRGCRERFDADFLETLVAHSSGRYFSAAPRLGDRDQARDRSPALLRGRRLAPMCYRSSSLRVSWRRRSASRGGRGNRTDLYRRVRVVLRVMLFRSTSARHRIRHGIRHTAARAGRGLCPCVANGRLRYMLIGYARVLKSGWLPVAGPAARRPAGRGRRRRQRLPLFLDPIWWVAPRGTRLSRNARSSHRPALVSLGYRSGSDQARWQPVVFRAGELNEDRASRAVDPCEHLLQ